MWRAMPPSEEKGKTPHSLYQFDYGVKSLSDRKYGDWSDPEGNLQL